MLLMSQAPTLRVLSMHHNVMPHHLLNALSSLRSLTHLMVRAWPHSLQSVGSRPCTSCDSLVTILTNRACMGEAEPNSDQLGDERKTVHYLLAHGAVNRCAGASCDRGPQLAAKLRVGVRHAEEPAAPASARSQAQKASNAGQCCRAAGAGCYQSARRAVPNKSEPRRWASAA